jgi:hypothetical protein
MLALLLFAPAVGVLRPAAQQGALSATLHTGTCTDVGPEVAALAPAFVPTGEQVGSTRSLPATNSFSAVPVALDAMLAADHAFVIAGADGEVLACGEVGGFLTDTGGLVVGFRSEPSTGLDGVAFLSPGDAPGQTNVSLFLTGEALARDAAGAANASLVQSDQTPAAAGLDLGTPEEDAETEQTEGAEPTTVPTERPVPTPTPTPAPGSSQSNPAPVGTTLESQGLAVTVNSAYFDYGFANAIPRGGYKVMILGVTFDNVSDQNRGYEASRFSGIDAVTGNTYDPVTLENVGVLLTDGDLQPGEYVSGTALIEVQESATSVIIKYDADIMGDEEDMYWS